MKNPEIDWNNLTEDKARFIFEQAKEYLTKTLEISEKLDQKGFTLLGFGIVIMNGLIAYITLQYQSLNHLLYPVLLYLITVIISNIFLLLAIRPRKWYITGNVLSNFLNDNVLQQDIGYIIIGEALNYSERIELNDKQNKYKVKYIKRALLTLILSSIIIFALFS